MKPFFVDRPDRIEALQKAAKLWEGTPFYPNGCVRGAGVSCQKYSPAIYIEVGFLPGDFAVPDGPMKNNRKLMLDFIEKLPQFQPVTDRNVFIGDMVGFAFGKNSFHLGVVVAEKRFTHCLVDAGVQERRIDDPTWSTRLDKIWRPVE